jgi:hypothetical protein
LLADLNILEIQRAGHRVGQSIPIVSLTRVGEIGADDCNRF